MRDFGGDPSDEAQPIRSLFYWGIVASVCLWTLYCAADLAYIAYVLKTRPAALLGDLPAEYEKGFFLGYCFIRLFWWAAFAIPPALVALLIRPRDR